MTLTLTKKSDDCNRKTYSCMACVNFEIEVPSRVDLKPWDIKVNPGKGWCKMHAPKVKKEQKKMTFNVGKKENIFD